MGGQQTTTTTHPDFREQRTTRDVVFEFEAPPNPTVGFQEKTYRSLGSAHPNLFQAQSGDNFGDGLSDLDMPSFPGFGGPGFGNMNAKMQQIQQQQQMQQTSSSSFSAKLASIQLSGAPISLKPQPVWIETHTSFVSAADPQVLFEAIQDSLSRGPVGVDVTVKQESGKMRGLVTQGARWARFQIRLYSDPQAQKTVVVEFQRREGEAAILNMLYQHVMQFLGPDFVTRRYDNTAMAAPPPVVLELPSELLEEPDQVLVSLENLLALCDSPYVDQQREAVSGLVALSAEHGAALAQAATTTHTVLMVVLIRLLASHNLIDIVRGSAVCLSNLLQAYSDLASGGGGGSSGASKGGTGKRAAGRVNKLSLENCQALLASMLENLRSPALLESLDTKRHISKSLQSLAKAHPQMLAADRGCVTTLNKFKSSKDAVLRAHVLDTLQLIQSNA